MLISRSYRIFINIAECVHLPIGRAPPAQFSLSDDASILIAKSANDIGIIVYSSLKSSHHCREAAKLTRRGFRVLSPEIFRLLVGPILDYGQQASSLYLRQDIIMMEKL